MRAWPHSGSSAPVPEAAGEHRAGEPHLVATLDFQRVLSRTPASRLLERVRRLCSEYLDTRRKRAEAALPANEKRFRAIYDQAPIGIALIDSGSGRFLEVNPRYTEIAGRTREEMLALDFQAITHPDDLQADLDNMERLRAGQIRFFRMQKRYFRRDDSIVWVELTVVPMWSEREVPRHHIAMVEDITERKRAEEARGEADRRKDMFLATLSHELRNPLAPIRNSIHVIDRAPPGGEQARRALSVISRQTEHLTRLVDDLLDVTRISRGRIHLQRERLDLSRLVRGAAEDHRGLFSRNGVELLVEGGDEPLFVDGDPTRLVQVIGNMLNNSAKFTPRGGHTNLSLERGAEDEVLIRVRDDGVGMVKETLHRLFEPFTQAETSLDRSHGGLGLGLSLVKGLVEMHGGSVTAQSAGIGKGSEFTIRLPLATPAMPGRAAPLPSAPNDAIRRVLVIEDNADAAESLRALLELDGHVVELASMGPEGLVKACAFQPDLILCDIGLPGMDGYEVARAIREEPQLRDSYLVALSGYTLHEDIARSREAGFDRHIAKPLPLEMLRQLLAETDSGLRASHCQLCDRRSKGE